MIHQRKISTSIGGGMLNLDASLDSDIDYEFFDSRGTASKSRTTPRKQRYRSNLTLRQCASVNLRQDFPSDDLDEEEGYPTSARTRFPKKTRSFTQGLKERTADEGQEWTLRSSPSTTSLVSGTRPQPAGAVRAGLDVIAEATDNNEGTEEEEEEIPEEMDEQQRDAAENKAEKRMEACKTASSPDMQDSRNHQDLEADALTHSLSCVSLLDNGLRTHYVEKRYKNGTRHSMSFSNERFREIERVNQILLRKIMDKKKPAVPVGVGKQPSPRTTARYSSADAEERARYLESRRASAAINRKRLQQRIDEENANLDRRIRQVKPVTKTRR